MIYFNIPLKPVPWARARSNGNRFFTQPNVARFKREFLLLSKPLQPKEPLTDALRLNVIFHLKAPQRRRSNYPVTRPDLDNFLKGIMDAGNGVFWKDDSQIVELKALKVYSHLPGAKPGIEISIQKMDE